MTLTENILLYGGSNDQENTDTTNTTENTNTTNTTENKKDSIRKRALNAPVNIGKVIGKDLINLRSFSKKNTSEKVDSAAELLDKIRENLTKVVKKLDGGFTAISKLKKVLSGKKGQFYNAYTGINISSSFILFIILGGVLGIDNNTKTTVYDYTKTILLIILFI